MPRVRTESKQSEILAAASRVFAARQYHEVLCDEIAQEAGVGKGTIYRYFRTKEDLYFATILQGYEAINHSLASAITAETSPEKRLERIARELFEYFWDRRSFYSLLYRNEQRFLAQEGRLKKNREHLVKIVEQTIREGVESGQFRQVDTKTAAEMFLGMIRAINVFRRESDRLDDLVAELIGLWARGIEKERS
ncbi:MAG: TetR/AcrR family transcriptional regulator [Thermoanaerobaculia bacterium]